MSVPPPPRYARANRGFSLVELSIVLVIIGLIAGGIVAARSLIRAAELRSVVSDLQRYEAAVLTFRDKYRALPGDMTDATMFWGAADGGDGLGADCVDATSSNGTTCNGNGNGRLNKEDGNAGTSGNEVFHAWVQLANAGLVEGSYTGRRTADPNEATPGVNVPASKIDGGGFTLLSFVAGAADPSSYAGDYNPTLRLGKRDLGYFASLPLLTAAEAYRVDSKLDDGRPGLGRVRPFHGNCVSPSGGAAQLTAIYNPNYSTDVVCALTYSLNDPKQ